ncbi:putative PIN domain protein [Candidatus Termititenax aidoneus]|uniref:PIN domain protein n=1 Tax=Termititenax aidoneus TaxID=2218524 RepID=A0A388TDG4_TERA1|nr:putative PIN domain protein [Candidatus Termititenax aidoneus]
MRAKAFIDTNIFVYIQRTDYPAKQKIASAVVDSYDSIISTQVLNEFCNIFTKKYPVPLDDLEKIIDALLGVCEISFVSAETIKQSLVLHKQYRYPYYDCLIIASALENGCAYLFTEDLQDGQLINGKLKIVDIFKHADELFV